MYVVTFYSFKGGVGRSMALVNAGVELARRKHCVLLVDFDLEAPGLDTFKALTPTEPSLGIVDFVHVYLSTGKAADLDEYVSRCQSETESGDIWLMPAGGSRANYASQFQHIDWGDLYANQDGFLLMEDLKQQWKERIQPDYVLIDSRTGHTDVSGICTRQLPDAVAIFYFPNEQNLRGVGKTVKEIRAQQSDQRTKEIQLHFIMSNVPDLDDEHQILEKKIEEFTSRFRLQEEPMMVHRYDSLSLLNQEIFTQSRPKSRLASEYREIVDRIVACNMGDRDGALRFLQKIEQRIRRRPWEEKSAFQDARLQLEEIGKRHGKDGEILYRLGLQYHREQELDKATSLYGRSVDEGYDNPEVFLDRARALADIGSIDEANRDAFRALNSNRLALRSIRRALKFINLAEFGKVANSNAVAALDIEQKARLATQLYFESKATRSVGIELIRSVMDLKPLSISDGSLRNEFGLVFISLGNFKRAREWFLMDQDGETDIVTAFNLAIAGWGVSSNLNKKEFEKVVNLHEEKPEIEGFDSANYFQCIALAYWAIGDVCTGLEYADKAQSALGDIGRTFSSWCYLYVNQAEFRQDVEKMVRLIEGDIEVCPPFLNVAREFTL